VDHGIRVTDGSRNWQVGGGDHDGKTTRDNLENAYNDVVDLFYWLSGFLVIALLIASWGLFGFMVWKAIQSQNFQWQHPWWGLIAAGSLFLTSFYHSYWSDLGLNLVFVGISLVIIPLGSLVLLVYRPLFAIAFAVPTFFAGFIALAYTEDISRFLPNPVTDAVMRHMLHSEGIRFPNDARRFHTSMFNSFGGEHYRDITFISDQLDEYIDPSDEGYMLDLNASKNAYRNQSCVFRKSDWFQIGFKIFHMKEGVLPKTFKFWENAWAVVQKHPGEPSRARICLIEL
jgi:hypothetical protein